HVHDPAVLQPSAGGLRRAFGVIRRDALNTSSASRALPAAHGAGRWWTSPVTPMVLALVLLAGWSLTVGAYPVTLSQALQAVLDRLGVLFGAAPETGAVASTVDTVL